MLKILIAVLMIGAVCVLPGFRLSSDWDDAEGNDDISDKGDRHDN